MTEVDQLNTSDKLSIRKLPEDLVKDVKSLFKVSDYYKYAVNEMTAPFETIISYGLFHATLERYIGLIEIYKQKPSNHIWINTIAISEDLLRKGYGTFLLDNALKDVHRELPFHNIILACEYENHIGFKFWTNNGFAVHTKMTSACNKPNVAIMTKAY